MKKWLLVTLFMVQMTETLQVCAQELPAAVEEDAALLFDETPDALDAVTVQTTEPLNLTAPQPTLLQSYYQAVLFCLLSSYLSIKQTCLSAKKYVAEYCAGSFDTSTLSK